MVRDDEADRRTDDRRGHHLSYFGAAHLSGRLYPLEVAVGGEACAWSSSEGGLAVSTGILVLHGSA